MGITGLTLAACADDDRRVESTDSYQTERSAGYDNSSEPMVRESQSK